MGFDIFSDEAEPKLELGNVIVKISVPTDPSVPYRETGWALLEIERDSHYIANNDWYWFGVKNPRHYNNDNWYLLEIRKQVWDWLREWELVELKAIGPEDSEYFATDKLMVLVEGGRESEN